MRRERFGIAPTQAGTVSGESGFCGFLLARSKVKSAAHLRIGASDAGGVRLPRGRPLMEA